MHPVHIITIFGLAVVATAQETTDPPASLPRDSELGGFETTFTWPGPSGTGTIWDCVVESEGKSHIEQIDMECTSIGNVTFPTSTSMIPARNVARQVHPKTVLEARMQRKFGVKARQDDTSHGTGLVAVTTQPGSPVPCSTVTVTSTTYVGSYPESCSPLPTPTPNAAEVTAMSIVGNMISSELSAIGPAQSAAANMVPAIFVSVLTANASHAIATGAMPVKNSNFSNATIIIPTLQAAASSGVLSPSPSQAKSIGTSIAVGLVANIIAAAGIAYLLV